MMTKALLFVCCAAYAVVCVSAAIDLHSSASWASEAFSFVKGGLSVIGSDIAGRSVTIRPQPNAFKSRADQLFSGSADKLRTFDPPSQEWLKSLFDKTVALAATTIVHGANGVVGAPEISTCQTFHMHIMQKTGTNDLVFVVHNREQCAMSTQDYQTCKAEAGPKIAECDTVKSGLLANAQSEKCSCVGGLGKHLMVYSTADQKLFYPKTYADMVKAALTVKNPEATPSTLFTGGWYSDIFSETTKDSYKVWKGGDININPDDSKIYLAVNTDHDNIIALFQAKNKDVMASLKSTVPLKTL